MSRRRGAPSVASRRSTTRASRFPDPSTRWISAPRTRTGSYGHPTLRLVAGRFPTGAGDVALTDDAAATFNVHIGGPFVANGVTRHVVGLVENPLDLGDEFALVAPGQANPPAQVTILFDASGQQIDAFRPRATRWASEAARRRARPRPRWSSSRSETIGLLFVGLVAAAGFAVMAQRRLRALGMLGALGATDRQVRLAMVANGAVVGVVGAVAGAVLGLATWVALAPRFERPRQSPGRPVPPAVVGDRGARWSSRS